MKLKNCIFSLVLVVIATLSFDALYAQDSSSTGSGKGVYREAWTLGFKVHTSGIGGEFRREKFNNAFSKSFWNVDISNIKHPKEQKSFTQSQDESNLIYGKLNSFYQIRSGVGKQKVIFEKLEIRGVQISTIYHVGLAAAWLKPVFVEVQIGDINENPRPSSEQYDPYAHPYERIIQREPWSTGVSSSRFVPGATAKFALNFEFSPLDDEIKALEVGAQVDGFTQPIPIMAFNRQYNVFFNVYVSFLFGSKTFL